MTGKTAQTWRILIGAGSFLDARDALVLLRQMDGPHASEIGGVLVEETVFAEAVDLPGQRVVTAAGAMTVVPSASQLQRQFESDARAFREMLSDIAGNRKWSFERRQGELLSHLRDAARGWDMLLVGHRRTHRLPGRVILVAPVAGVSDKAAGFARDLAQALDTSVHRFTLSATAAPEDAGNEHFVTQEALRERLDRMPVAALVLDMPVDGQSADADLHALIAAARCPVFVLEGAGRDAQA
ncbi:MAG: hypothetical protein R3256_05620 [Thalassovita sp.]|nr:hypothetical protein [Thalassovita sp.]